MEPLQFMNLPLDIKKSILYYIDRPTDLKALCLTCKDVRQIATPILYRSMHLFVGGQQDLRLIALLSRDNPGIPHIREMFFRLEKMTLLDKRRHYHSDDSSDEEEAEENTVIPGQRAQFTVGLILDRLPPNTLETFSWQNWEPFSIDNFLLLCKTQKSLKVLDLGPMDRPLLPLIEKNPNIFKDLPDLHSVDLYPDTLDRLKVSQKLLQDKPRIEYLCISNAFEYSNEVPDDLHDSSTQSGLLSRTLFSHMQPFDRCEPMCLRNLDLDTINLRYSPDSWLRIIKFSSLVRLDIRNCAGAETIFAQLSKPHLRPSNLKSLRWLDDEASEPHTLEAFEGFIQALQGLETLHVVISKMRELPKVAVLLHHRKTLVSLTVHSQQSHDNIFTYSINDYGRLCEECSELRQLSIMFPETKIEPPSPSHEFVAFLAHTMKLRNLVTLNIRRWPSTRDSFNVPPYNRLKIMLELYEHLLQRITQSIFESSDQDAKEKGYGYGNRSNLSVVAWGGNGKTRHEGSGKFKLKQIPFVRGKKVDAFGQTSMLAVQTIWRLVQFVEPESDILNYSLYDMHDSHQGHGP